MLDTEKRNLGKLTFNDRGNYSATNEYSYLDTVIFNDIKFVFIGLEAMTGVEPGTNEDAWFELFTIIRDVNAVHFGADNTLVRLNDDNNLSDYANPANLTQDVRELSHLVFRNGALTEEIRPELPYRISSWIGASALNEDGIMMVKTRAETYRFYGATAALWGGSTNDVSRRPAEVVFQDPGNSLDSTRIDGVEPPGQIVPMGNGVLILEHEGSSVIYAVGNVQATLRIHVTGAISSLSAIHFPAVRIRGENNIESIVTTARSTTETVTEHHAMAITDGNQILGLTDGVDSEFNQSVFGASGGHSSALMTEVTGVFDARIRTNAAGHVAIVAHIVDGSINRIICWGNSSLLPGTGTSGFVSPSLPHIIVPSAAGLSVFEYSDIFMFAFNRQSNIAEIRLGGRNDARQLGQSLDPADAENAEFKAIGLIVGNQDGVSSTWNSHVRKMLRSSDGRFVFILLTDGRLYWAGNSNTNESNGLGSSSSLGANFQGVVGQFNLFPQNSGGGATTVDGRSIPAGADPLIIDDIFVGCKNQIYIVYNNRRYVLVGGNDWADSLKEGLGLRVGAGNTRFATVDNPSATTNNVFESPFYATRFAFIPPTWAPDAEIIHIRTTQNACAIFTNDGRMYTAGGRVSDTESSHVYIGRGDNNDPSRSTFQTVVL